MFILYFLSVSCSFNLVLRAVGDRLDDAYDNGEANQYMSRADWYSLAGYVSVEKAVDANNRNCRRRKKCKIPKV